MDLVHEYYALAKESTSYREKVSDATAAEKYNRCADRMAAIAAEIQRSFPECRKAFFGLLLDNDSDIRLWVAHHILEYMNDEPYCRKCALREIRHRARRDHTACGFAEKLWLKEWYSRHPKDRWLSFIP